MDALKHTELNQRYHSFLASGVDESSMEEARELFAQFWGKSKAELSTPELQRALWRRSKVFFLGYGENVDCEPLVQDAQVVELLAGLPHRDWSPDAQGRAQQVQDAYESLLALASPLCEKTPRAKLHRAMLLLLPGQLHFGLNGEYSKHIYRQVVGGSKVGVQRLQGAVLARHRLRAVLGPEEEGVLDDHIRRGQFLSNLAQQVIQASKPATEEVGGRESVLELWPIGRQSLSVPLFTDWLTLLRDTVNAAWEPIARDELVEVLREDKGYTQTPANLRGMLRLVKHLGFVREESGAYTVEEDPAEELMAEATPDVLVEALLVRVYGFARALRVLESGLASPELVQRLRDEGLHRPAAYSVVARLRELSLVDDSGETMRLSPSGKRWAARLPETLPVREAKSVVPVTSTAKPTRDWPSFEHIANAFETDPALQGFVFPRSQLLELYTSWHFHPRKRFVLLSGLSGTGKTALLTHYARITSEFLGADPKQHLALVPVRPDWRDPSGLLGYLNALHADPSFQVEPALRLVMQAHQDPGSPYFLILDEMNLARVERYFAPFLSAMESEEGYLDLHAEADPIGEVPPKIPWPTNLFIGGTVNMDESTHAFSDKVLDRAFTMELWTADLAAFFAKQTERDLPLEKLLLDLYSILEPVRRHFAYRSASEVLSWVRQAATQSSEAPKSALWDAAVFSKILPRLRGAESAELLDALSKLESLFEHQSMPRCGTKAKQMRSRLQDTGVTGFWS